MEAAPPTNTKYALRERTPAVAGIDVGAHGEPNNETEIGNPDNQPNKRPDQSLTCPRCNRPFQKRANYNRHISTCKDNEIEDPNACRFCSNTYNTPAGARQHERKAYTEQYHSALCQVIQRSETEILRSIATIEATCTATKYLRQKIAEETGLTVNQIKSKKRLPVYKQYLEAALEQSGKTSASNAPPSTNTIEPNATTSEQPTPSSPNHTTYDEDELFATLARIELQSKP